VDQPQVGTCVVVMADVITFRVLSSASNGRLSVVELVTPPGGGPPPLHAHPPDEVFTVVEGSVTLFVGDPLAPERKELVQGDIAHVRGGVAHTFRNFSEQSARMLLTFTPGEMMERFFVEAGIPVTDPQNLPVVDFESEVRRVFQAGAALGMEQFDPAYA
jgi:quercetin dioxygenase-like cupin family protein